MDVWQITPTLLEGDADEAAGSCLLDSSALAAFHNPVYALKVGLHR